MRFINADMCLADCIQQKVGHRARGIQFSENVDTYNDSRD